VSEVDSVLVVDDDEILLDVMATHLRKRGYAVNTAGDVMTCRYS